MPYGSRGITIEINGKEVSLDKLSIALKESRKESQRNEIEIIMTNVNEPPKIKVNGKEITGIISVSHYYQSKKSESTSGVHQYVVEYWDEESKTIRSVSADKM